MMIPFTKMHGLGNDFVVIDNTHGTICLPPETIKALAHRNFGIGFDQLLIVETNTTADADFNYIIYNADGVEVEQCGNGARCFAKFVYDNGLTSQATITAKTLGGIITLNITKSDKRVSYVSVDMEIATMHPQDILTTPLTVEHNQVTLEGYALGLVDIGNPHAVYVSSSLSDENVVHIGQVVQSSPVLANGINVNIVEINSRASITLETYERGSGHTLACGTGACATAAYLHHIGAIDECVEVIMRGGNANITISDRVTLTGPAEYVFEGVITQEHINEYT